MLNFQYSFNIYSHIYIHIYIQQSRRNMVILWSDYFQSSFNLLDDLGINHNYLKNMETSDTYAEQVIKTHTISNYKMFYNLKKIQF